MTPQTTDELARRLASKIVDQYRDGIAYEIGNNRDVAVDWITKQISTELRELVAENESLKRNTLFDDAASVVYLGIQDEREQLLADKERLKTIKVVVNKSYCYCDGCNRIFHQDIGQAMKGK